MKVKIAVIVHPGSCCGSADFNLGITEAHDKREEIRAASLSADGIVVVDGDFDEEVVNYTTMSYLCRLAEYRIYTGPTRRELETAAKAIMRTYPQATFLVTGAWGDQGEGCADVVAKNEIARRKPSL